MVALLKRGWNPGTSSPCTMVTTGPFADVMKQGHTDETVMQLVEHSRPVDCVLLRPINNIGRGVGVI
jgi:hypothetical protein